MVSRGFPLTQIGLLFAAALGSSAISLPTRLGAQNRPPDQGDSTIAAVYGPAADTLIRAATRDSAAYRRLGLLVDQFGSRFSGSAGLEAAIDWILAQMKSDGLQNVRGEPVMVPHWIRGREAASLVRPRPAALAMLGLGGSVGTPPGGITAPVLVVTSFQDLKARAGEARGKIILFDVPFTSYRETVRYRVEGPSAAARAGAVACLIRSVASFSIRSPHTGTMRYDSSAARIPAAALSTEDAAMLHRFQDRGVRVVVKLTMLARTLPDAPSRNVVAEIPGRERPDEVVVMGGHIDSWDVGQGAVDDGGGSVAAWEALRLIHHSGLKPRRTIRVVLWTNEENGGRGALAYRDAHTAELPNHVLAIESDNGTFSPHGFRFSGTDAALNRAKQIEPLLRGIGADQVSRESDSPEADIAPLVERGVPGMGLDVDRSRYFWFHHSEGDMLDKVDPAELGRCVAALAVMAYTVADLPESLPRTATR
jgi:carboxypeptidase Q